jgi:cytochrome c oxidase assembly factor CtaG
MSAVAASADPALLATLALGAGGYALAARRARRWPRSRTAAFLAGLALIAVALQSALDADAGRLLSAHMGQHLLLAVAAAPLLALGAPVSLALRSLHGRRREQLASALRSAPLRALTHPAAALGAFAAAMALWHLPAPYEAALRHPALHALEHLSFLGTAYLLWGLVLGVEPFRHRLGAMGRAAVLLLAMVPMGLVGAWLASAPGVRYHAYLAPAAAHARSALDDQQLAGALMWVAGALPMAGAVVALAWSALRSEHGRTLAREAAEARRAEATG